MFTFYSKNKEQVRLKNGTSIADAKIKLIMGVLKNLLKADFAEFQAVVEYCHDPDPKRQKIAAASFKKVLDQLDALSALKISSLELINVVESVVSLDMVIHDSYMSLNPAELPSHTLIGVNEDAREFFCR